MTDTVFLTNGKMFLGPYFPGEIQALIRGKRTLQEDRNTVDIYHIKAETEEQARQTFRRSSYAAQGR